MKRLSKAFWVWCEFTEKDCKYLNNLKFKVQQKLDSPKFDPHLTLAGPFQIMDKNTIFKIQRFVELQNEINLNCYDYFFKDVFFESFYISLEKSKELNYLRNQIFLLQGYAANLEYSPHISLAYGNHNKLIKIDIKSHLPKTKRLLSVDKISIVYANEEIKSWKIIARFKMKKYKIE